MKIFSFTISFLIESLLFYRLTVCHITFLPVFIMI